VKTENGDEDDDTEDEDEDDDTNYHDEKICPKLVLHIIIIL
jgi:hypothetical protein